MNVLAVHSQLRQGIARSNQCIPVCTAIPFFHIYFPSLIEQQVCTIVGWHLWSCIFLVIVVLSWEGLASRHILNGGLEGVAAQTNLCEIF